MNRFDNIDCFEGIKSIEDHSVDLILEDMPYNMTNCDFEIKIDLEKYWQSRIKILKPKGLVILTAVQPFATDLINSNRKMFRYDIIWKKNLLCGGLNAKKMPMRSHELLLIFYEKLPTYNPIMLRGGAIRSFTSKAKINVYGKQNIRVYENKSGEYYPHSVLEIAHDGERCNSSISNKDWHPTQKPVGLFEYLIKTYTNKGDLVFDGFAGSGTTGIACEKSNRNYIMFEKEKKYFDMAQKRLTQFRSQLKLAI